MFPSSSQLLRSSREDRVILTARNSYQVCELLRLHQLSCKVVGHHWGKNRILKMVGTCLRAAQLLPIIMKHKPDLAVSHGSRAQILSALVTGLPVIVIIDYEFSVNLGFRFLSLTSSPNRPESGLGSAQLGPDPSVKDQLGLDGRDLVVTVRPPATEAHYHNPEAEMLLDATLGLLTHRPDVHVILLPRNEKQAYTLRKQWGKWIANRRIVTPSMSWTA